MLISQHANLPENRNGFWVEKLYNETHRCSYLVYYRGLTEFRDSISEAKKALRDRLSISTVSSVDSRTPAFHLPPNSFLEHLAEVGRNRRLFP
jgi:hypothetical protein